MPQFDENIYAIAYNSGKELRIITKTPYKYKDSLQNVLKKRNITRFHIWYKFPYGDLIRKYNLQDDTCFKKYFKDEFSNLISALLLWKLKKWSNLKTGDFELLSSYTRHKKYIIEANLATMIGTKNIATCYNEILEIFKSACQL